MIKKVYQLFSLLTFFVIGLFFVSISMANATTGFYIIGDGSGGGGGGDYGGSNSVGGVGGAGGGGDDTIAGTAGNDVIFGDGSGGGAGGWTMGGSGGSGADIINGGAGDDVIFGDGFDGYRNNGWVDGYGGLGGGGGGGGAGDWAVSPPGGTGGIGAGGGGAGGGAVGGSTVISGIGNSGGNNGGAGGNSAVSAESETGSAGSGDAGHSGGGGGAFGGASGGDASTLPTAGGDGDTDQHTYDDSTGDIKSYFSLANLRSIITNYPNFGSGDDVIDGEGGTNDLFGLGGNNTFIVDSIDNPTETRLWDFKVGDVLKLKIDGVQISQASAEVILANLDTSDYDEDGVADDVSLSFKGKPIKIMNITLDTSASSNGDIVASNSTPDISLDNSASVIDTVESRYWYWAAYDTSFVNDLDGDSSWNGGILEFEISQGGVANNDLLFFTFSSTIEPIIDISGTVVTSGGVTIGSVDPSDGVDDGATSKVTFTFNSNVTNKDIRQILNNILIHAPSSNSMIFTTSITQSGGSTYSDSRVLGTAGAAPVVSSASTSTDGASVRVVFNKAMLDLTGKHTQFLTRTNSNPNLITAVSQINSTTYDLTLTQAVTIGQTVTLDYIQGDAFSTDYGILASFSGASVESVSNVSEVTDSTAPVRGGSGVITAENLASSSLTLAWTKATDDSTPSQGLKYYVYQNVSGKGSSDMDTVSEIEDTSNATLLNSGGTENIASYDVSGLSSDTYYFNVLVVDLADNKTIYEVKTQAVGSAPTLTAGAVTRTSDTSGTVKFTSSNSGRYFYEVVASGASAPTIDTSNDDNGTPCETTEQTITDPTGLTSGAKDLYVVVKDYADNVSDSLKIEIHSYSYTLSYSSGTGGSISGSSSQTIVHGSDGTAVTAVADSGYQFSEWSDSSTSNPRTDTSVISNLSISASFTSLGGGSAIAPPSIGTGSVDISIPISVTKTVHNISAKGLNVLMHIYSGASFEVIPSRTRMLESHKIEILDLDMITGKIKIEISSEPQIVELLVGDLKNVDLDNDGINDLELVYNELFVNRIDITIKQLEFVNEVKPVVNNNFNTGFGLYKTQLESSMINSILAVERQDEVVSQEVVSQIDWSAKTIEQLQPTKYNFTIDLHLGVKHESVRDLQRYLNNNGFTIVVDGLGSKGNETDFFGSLTKQALIRFQQAKDITPAWGYFGPLTREVIK